MKIVEVIWRDAVAYDEHVSIEEAADYEPLHARSVGYLMHQDRRKVVLAQTVYDNENVKLMLIIPGDLILHTRVLGE